MDWRYPLLLAMSGLAIGPAFGEVTITPGDPGALDTVRIHVPGGELHAQWGDPEVSMSSGTITVILHDAPVQLEAPVPDVDWPIGQLPAGSYKVEVLEHVGSTEYSHGETSFTVSPRTGTVPRADYGDMWWVPSESGWGVSIHQHPSNVLFVAWFVYGADGKPSWYVMPTGEWQTTTYYAGTVYKTTGPYFAGAFDPASVSVAPAGTAYPSFLTYQTAIFGYVVDGVAGQKSLVRQSF